jgi:hypothetical protein
VANYPNVYAVLVADECLESTAFPRRREKGAFGYH